MRINCVSCGHQIEVDDESYAYYSGPLRCWVCLEQRLAELEHEKAALFAALGEPSPPPPKSPAAEAGGMRIEY